MRIVVGKTGSVSATFTAANNGLSVDPVSGAVVLGNDVGVTPGPARLLSDREIEMFGNFLQLINPGTGIISQINNQRWYMEDPVTGITNTMLSGSFDIDDILNSLFTHILPGRIDLQNTQDVFLRTNYTPANAVTDFFSDATGGGYRVSQVSFGVYTFSSPSGNTVIGSFSGWADNGAKLQVTGSLTVGNIATASAKIHVAAGAAGAGTAPFKYSAGTVNITPENGAKEFDGTNEFVTAGGTRYTLAKTLTATAALDFPNTAAQLSSDLTIALTGAALGDVVLLGVPNAAVLPDSCFTAWVSSANTVTVRFNNYSAGAQDPASGTFRVSIVKY